ncbi:hypothetical protein MBH78_04005 [Oceanimonas sp. NS1]|nr:hypothetical protein [Oceanimonas sp. NS1]
MAGLMLFPAPGEAATHLLESFLLATFVPVAISALLLLVPARQPFDFAALASRVRSLES